MRGRNLIKKINSQLRADRVLKCYAKRDRLIDSDIYNELKRKTKCPICKNNFKKLQIHHKIPLKAGGTNKRDNLIAICKSCHKKIHSK